MRGVDCQDSWNVYNSIMSDPRPMQSVLDFWAKSLTCPVCDQSDLKVMREAGVPDLLYCPHCESEFEVADGGDVVRMLKYPLAMGMDLYGKWLSLAEIRRRVLVYLHDNNLTPYAFIAVTGGSRSSADVPVKRKSGKAGAALPAADEPPQRALDQARQLLHLGNSLEDVRAILEKDPRLNAYQVDAILDQIDEPRKSQTLEKFLLGVLLLLVVVVGLFFLNSMGMLDRGRMFIAGVLSGEVVQIIPPTPVVYRYAPQGVAYGCPPTQQGAAALFGGKQEHWNFDGKNWLYTDIKAVRIYVPEGLMARYSYFDPILVLEKVDGPAVIDPVMALSIDCYR